MPLPLRECSAAPSLLRQRSETGPSGEELAQTGLATAGVPTVTTVVPGVAAGVTHQKSLVWGQGLLSAPGKEVSELALGNACPASWCGVFSVFFKVEVLSFVFVFSNQSLHVPCR